MKSRLHVVIPKEMMSDDQLAMFEQSRGDFSIEWLFFSMTMEKFSKKKKRKNI